MPSYDIDTLPLPAVASGAAFYTGLNSSGAIVGYIISKDHFAVFEDVDGMLTVTDSPPGSSISAGGINSDGTVAGTLVGAPSAIFEIRNGAYGVLPAPTDATVYTVRGIDDAGAVVGALAEDDGTHDGFVYRNGTYSRVAVAGATTTTLTAISNAGVVAGYATHADGSVTSFTDSNGAIAPIVVPGSTYTIATGINAAGTVVGYYEDGNLDASGAANAFGFIESGGVYTKIDQAGSSDVELHGITDSGAILGEAFDTAAKVERPFLIMPHGVAAPTGRLRATRSFDATGTPTGETRYDVSGLVVSQADYDITGKPYTGTLYTYDAAGQLLSALYTGLKGPFQAFESDYLNGDYAGTRDFYAATGQPYAAYEYDYHNGTFAGCSFTITAVPSGASYASYAVDYDYANAYLGARYFLTDVGQEPYTGEEVDIDASGTATRVLLTGVAGQPYQSLELDYAGGTYTGYKTFATGIAGQAYKTLEEDVSAANVVSRVIYGGLTATPYSTVEQDYMAGAPSRSTFTFTGITGQAFNAYAVTQNAAGVQVSETIDNTDGSHTLLGSASNLVLDSVGNDTITGGGAGETFSFRNVFGQDAITDFAGHTTGTGHDTIALQAADFGNFSTLLAHARNVNGGVAFQGLSGSQLTLDRLDKTTLAGLASDFVFRA